MFWDRATPQSNAKVTEYLNELYGYAMILVHDPAIAGDLVRETYAREIASIGATHVAQGKKNRLFTTLRNVWLKYVESRRNEGQLHNLEGQVRSDKRFLQHSTNSSDPRASKADHVRAAIQKLPQGLREIVFLHEYEGFSYPEIAAILNCPVSIVAPQLRQAREKLRMLLAEELIAPIRFQSKPQDTKPSGASALRYFNKETFLNN